MTDELEVVHLFASKFLAAETIVDKFVKAGGIDLVIVPKESYFDRGLEPFVIVGRNKTYEIHTVYQMPDYDELRDKNS